MALVSPGGQLPGKRGHRPRTTRAPYVLLGCKPAAAIPRRARHRLPQEVGMAIVPRVLLDRVAQDPSQAGRPTVGPRAPGPAAPGPVGQRLATRERAGFRW